jgi:hypothetical protein
MPLLINLIVASRIEGADAPLPGLASAGWRAVAVADSDWQPALVNADRERRMRLTRNGQAVEAYIADYHEQRLGKKLGGVANRPEADARVIDAGTLAGDPRFGWRQLEQEGRRSLLVFTYRVGARPFASASRAQLWYAWRTLTTLRSPGSQFIGWRVACAADCAGALALIESQLIEDGLRP